MCSNKIYFPVIFFLNINFIYPATIQDINEEYLLKIGEVITFCNGHIYYGSPCISQYNVKSTLYVMNVVKKVKILTESNK